jgi:hypothetical protein
VRRRTARARTGLAGLILIVATLTSGCLYTPPSPYNQSYLSDVAAVSRNDAWAVGTSFTDSSWTVSHPLLEHFDGRSWSVVPLPGTAGPRLDYVTAVSATDIWATGFGRVFSEGGGRTVHWDGHAWSVTVDPPGLIIEGLEHGHGGLVMALALNTTTSQYELLTRTANNWQPIAAPSPPGTGAPCDGGLIVSGLTVLTTSDLWVVGGTSKGGNFPTSGCPYAAHWNGASWTTFTPPNPTGAPVASLSAISARPDGTVWAVGHGLRMDPRSGKQYVPGFAVRWNGTAWQSLCNAGCFTTAFSDIDATGANVWVTAGEPVIQTQSDSMHLFRWAGNGWAAQPVQTFPSLVTGFPAQNFSGPVSVRGGIVVFGGHAEGGGEVKPLVDIRDDK